ncbi:MAG TPA: hypothetical protein VMU11_00960 [Verrucomicrobiae bacterium]|nr:hypothetical protein [Verrucomicrobiae bacterium]
MEVIRINLRGAHDRVAQESRILATLRRKRLLNELHLFRGFRREHLENLMRDGLDHDPRYATFASTKEQLLSEFAKEQGENALTYALDGGCMAVYTKDVLETDGVGGCGYLANTNIKHGLAAVLVLTP